MFQLPYDLFDLVHALPHIICVAVLIFIAKMPPLEAIDRSKITLFTLRETQVVEELS
jgi:hypothetical protein